MTHTRVTESKLALPALLLAWAIPVSQLHAASDIRNVLPPPGLYQLDLVTQKTDVIQGRSIETHQRIDGKTGDAVIYQVSEGQRMPERIVKGNGQQTQCIAPYQGTNASVLAGALASAGVAACPNQSTEFTSDGFVQKANCSGIQSTLIVKKLGNDTWEFTSDTTMQGGTQPSNSAGIQGLAAAMAQHGTPEQQALARKAMKEMPGMQERMAQGQSEMQEKIKNAIATAKTPEDAAMLSAQVSQMTGAQSPVMTSSSHMVERKTRIGGACKPSGK
ncbi:hypothetical protein KSF73_14090 [Burkholderiaceae bacterium DAT-1]|nr:hypothetical protein [Burkholderiaceae bacterium DAT-1]